MYPLPTIKIKEIIDTNRIPQLHTNLYTALHVHYFPTSSNYQKNKDMNAWYVSKK